MSDEQKKNLLSGTRDWSGAWGNANAWYTNGVHDGFTVMSRKGAWNGMYTLAKLTAGHTYTFSACVKVEPGQYHPIGIFVTHSDPVNDTYLANSEVDYTGSQAFNVADGEWHVISHTVTVMASKSAKLRVEAYGDFTLSVCAYMLVEGTEPAAWAPAEGETLTADAVGGRYE